MTYMHSAALYSSFPTIIYIHTQPNMVKVLNINGKSVNYSFLLFTYLFLRLFVIRKDYCIVY